jgi:hypothetical protein
LRIYFQFSLSNWRPIDGSYWAVLPLATTQVARALSVGMKKVSDVPISGARTFDQT